MKMPIPSVGTATPPRPPPVWMGLLFGPFAYFRARWKTGVALVFAVGFLTVLTQVGGLLLWLSVPVLARIPVGKSRIARGAVQWAVFWVFYLGFVWLALPPLAKSGGRVPLPCRASVDFPLELASPVYCLLARNYVTPPLRQLLKRETRAFASEFPGVSWRYLDANFPFFDDFPLLPHLSHDDGRKVDLALFFRRVDNQEPLPGPPWSIGYWAYVQPRASDPQPCQGMRSGLRWDFTVLQPWFAFAELDPAPTRRMIQRIARAPETQKILLEPHLKHRLGLSSSKIRFQGCHAARHDDHLHAQVKTIP